MKFRFAIYGLLLCLLTSCSDSEDKLYLPPGSTLVRKIASESSRYTVIVQIDSKKYIWVYYHWGNGTIGTLCPYQE